MCMCISDHNFLSNIQNPGIKVITNSFSILVSQIVTNGHKLAIASGGSQLITRRRLVPTYDQNSSSRKSILWQASWQVWPCKLVRGRPGLPYNLDFLLGHRFVLDAPFRYGLLVTSIGGNSKFVADCDTGISRW